MDTEKDTDKPSNAKDADEQHPFVIQELPAFALALEQGTSGEGSGSGGH